MSVLKDRSALAHPPVSDSHWYEMAIFTIRKQTNSSVIQDFLFTEKFKETKISELEWVKDEHFLFKETKISELQWVKDEHFLFKETKISELEWVEEENFFLQIFPKTLNYVVTRDNFQNLRSKSLEDRFNIHTCICPDKILNWPEMHCTMYVLLSNWPSSYRKYLTQFM
jgi:hypothetical protein